MTQSALDRYLASKPEGVHNYQVQTSKTRDPKSSYENRLTTTHEGQAVRYFAGINVGYGYRKRLLLDGKVIARVAS